MALQLYVRELHEAVLYDNLDDIVPLVKEGADINQQDSSNRTCLDYCVSLHATSGLVREVAFPPEAVQKGKQSFVSSPTPFVGM